MNNSSEMGFSTLDSRFPDSTEVRIMFRDESPFYVIGGTELGNHSFRCLLFEELVQFFELSIRADKICSMIAPD